MHLYCTLFDRNYVSRGLALYDSLLRHRRQFSLVVLCLDETTHDILTTLALPNMELVSLPLLEKWDPDLVRARSERTTVEYYFTCKPVLMKFLAEKYANARWITYLDSDLFYFADPRILEREYAHSTVALTPHRFPPRLSERNQFGRFNAGWVSTSCGEEGRRFIEWWRVRCIEWCQLEAQVERFGDQKYLDQVPGLFKDVAILDHVGANLAPWNVDGLDIRGSGDGVAVDGKPLVFYHFHGVRKVLGRLYDSGLQGYGVQLPAELRKCLYRPYLAKLSDGEDLVGSIRKRTGAPPISGNSTWTDSLRNFKRAAQLVASGTCVIGP